MLREWPLPRLDGDKHARGTAVIVGGGRQTPGAVLLAAEVALRLGAGKVQIATTASTAALVAVALPEGYVEALPESPGGDLLPSSAGRILELAADADALLMGPGMSDPLASSLLLAEVVPRLDCTLVLDALATAYLTPDLRRVAHLSGRALITPNVTELAAMLAIDPGDVRQDPEAPSGRSRARRGPRCSAEARHPLSPPPTGGVGSRRPGRRASQPPGPVTSRRGRWSRCALEAPRSSRRRRGQRTATASPANDWLAHAPASWPATSCRNYPRLWPRWSGLERLKPATLGTGDAAVDQGGSHVGSSQLADQHGGQCDAPPPVVAALSCSTVPCTGPGTL